MAGGYPELWANPGLAAADFFEDYIQTYLERELNGIVRAANLRQFRRFIVCCALCAGQLLNYSGLAKDTDMSAATMRQWISVLEASGVIVPPPPWLGNVGKRLVKSPKLYFCDNALLCHLLNITDEGAFFDHPARGRLWENLVCTELLKTTGYRPGRQLFFLRDHSGMEVDFLIETGGAVLLVEAKASEQVRERKLPFAKARELFGARKVACALACNLQASQPLSLRKFEAVNPLLHDLRTLGVTGSVGMDTLGGKEGSP